MKPTTNTMQKPALEATVEVQNDHSSPRRSKTAVIGFGIIAVLLISSTVIAVMTFVQVKRVTDQWEALSDGKEMNLERMETEDSNLDEEDTVETEDSNLDEEDTVVANVTYHLPLLNETIEEKVVVTNDEEDITTPELRIIYDYNRGYAVTHFVKNGTDVDICYVRRFTPDEKISRIKNIVNEEKRDVVVTSETETELYTSAGEPFDRNLLSERAAAMCENSEVVLMIEAGKAVPGNTDGDSAIRKKRQYCRTRCGYVCYRVTVIRYVRRCKYVWARLRCNDIPVRIVVVRCVRRCFCR